MSCNKQPDEITHDGEGEHTRRHDDDLATRRRQVLDRDDYTCQLCGSRQPLHIHHIHYRSQGGTHELANLLTLCHCCHRHIHDRGMRVGTLARGPAKP